MHEAGASDHRLADVIGVVERRPVGRLSIAPDGLLEIGALVARGGRVHIVPRCGVSDTHLSILHVEAELAAVHGVGGNWLRVGGSCVTVVRVQSSSESIRACASSGVGRASLAWRFQASA